MPPLNALTGTAPRNNEFEPQLLLHSRIGESNRGKTGGSGASTSPLRAAGRWRTVRPSTRLPTVAMAMIALCGPSVPVTAQEILAKNGPFLTEPLYLGSAGDQDGDGRPEVISSYVTHTLYDFVIRSIDPDGTMPIHSWSGDWPPEAEEYYDMRGPRFAGVGDLNGDGIDEVVMTPWPATGVLYFSPDGIVDSFKDWPGLPDLLGSGLGVRELGTAADVNGDGILDVVLGYPEFNLIDLGFLDSSGDQPPFVRIGRGTGGFTGWLFSSDRFGASATSIGDLDGNGTPDLAVGAPGTSAGGGRDTGAVWILFMRSDGTVIDQVQISRRTPLLSRLDPGSEFGRSVAPAGDLDCDGIPDLIVGAPLDNEACLAASGAVWYLTLTRRGVVTSVRKIDGLSMPPTFSLEAEARFGERIVSVPDVDGDGVDDHVVGATGWDWQEWWDGHPHRPPEDEFGHLWVIRGRTDCRFRFAPPAVELGNQGISQHLEVALEVMNLEELDHSSRLRLDLEMDGEVLRLIEQPVELAGNATESFHFGFDLPPSEGDKIQLFARVGDSETWDDAGVAVEIDRSGE